MVVLGLLTGVSYQSGLDYYKNINEQFMKLVPKGKLMPPNPELVMVSVDCDEYAAMLVGKDWAGVARYLAKGVGRLVRAEVDVLVICSNTAHISVPLVRELHPDLPVLHIADATAKAIRDKGLKRVGLLGTEPTMREDYLKAQLRLHGIETIVPDSDADLSQIFQFIMDELGFGEFKESTRAFFVEQVHKLAARGAEGVIMGCTEIELLLRQADTPDVPLFASAELHIEAASRVAAGLCAPDAYAPAGGDLAAAPKHGAPPPQSFDAAAVRRLLPVGKAIDAAARAMRSLSDGSGAMPVRSVMRLPIEQFGILANMPACLGGYAACKTQTVFPANAGTALSAHQGATLLFSADDGRLLSISDAHEVTLRRTAAASAVATRALSRDAPSVLALLGTGPQALAHFEAIRAVRTITAVHVWGRNAARAAAVAKAIGGCGGEGSGGVPALVFESAQACVAEADIVCTLTSATVPVLEGAWLKRGAHVNAVGACTPAHRELDTAAVRGARLFVDTRDACLREPGDLVVPLREGELTEEHLLGEVGAVLSGALPGRTTDDEITLFKSVGIALEDLTAAVAIREAAMAS